MEDKWRQAFGSRGLARPAFVVGGLLLALLGSGCLDIDRMGLGAPDPSVRAVPSVICPGETTTVSWDAGPNYGDDCLDPTTTLAGPGRDPNWCKTVTLSNDGGLPTEPPVRPIENTGSRSFAPTRTTTFTMNATWAGHDWTHEGSATVSVIDTGGAVQTFTMEGGCAGGRPVWEGIPLDEILSDCVGVTAVCNTSGHLLVINSERGPSATLRPGECTADFNGEGANLTATPLDFIPLPDMCGSTSTSGGPPDLEIQVAVECNMDLPSCPFDTTSAPIISAPDETPSGPVPICNLEATCGDGACDTLCENASNCAPDCAPEEQPGDGGEQPEPGDGGEEAPPPPPEPVCGDGQCDAGENPNSCPADCAPPPPPGPACTTNDDCPDGQYCTINGQCAVFG